MTHLLFSLPASLETYQSLGNFMYEHGIEEEMYVVVDRVISEWMAGISDKKAKASATTIDGYQWKDVFLPAGTLLRNVYRRTSYLARVEGRDILFDGQSVSPAQFVNAVSGNCRNAWTTMWVRFPNDNEWKRALTLRKTTRVFKSKQDRIREKKSE